MANIIYPENANEATKNFVDKVNEVINRFGGGVIKDFYLNQNGVQNAIYKVVLPNFIIATFESFDDDGTGWVNTEEHYEKATFVKYDKKLNPTKTLVLPFNGISTVEVGISSIVS